MFDHSHPVQLRCVYVCVNTSDTPCGNRGTGAVSVKSVCLWPVANSPLKDLRICGVAAGKRFSVPESAHTRVCVKPYWWSNDVCAGWTLCAFIFMKVCVYIHQQQSESKSCY